MNHTYGREALGLQPVKAVTLPVRSHCPVTSLEERQISFDWCSCSGRASFPQFVKSFSTLMTYHNRKKCISHDQFLNYMLLIITVVVNADLFICLFRQFGPTIEPWLARNSLCIDQAILMAWTKSVHHHVQRSQPTLKAGGRWWKCTRSSEDFILEAFRKSADT